MYDRIRRWTLAILKTPVEPRPPMGDPASLKVFNAGRNYFRLRMAGWVVAEVLALAGLIFWTAMLVEVEVTARVQSRQRAAKAAEQKAARQQPAPNQPEDARNQGSRQNRGKDLKARLKENLQNAAREGRGRVPGDARRMSPWAAMKQACVELALLLPAGSFLVIWAVKIFSMLLFLAQLPITYAVRRLDYEMRWYMVTDRSLRIRSGVWQVCEATMSFANIQQVAVSQGPLQRLLGLADVKVQSAGGGGEGHCAHGEADMHSGLFHSVTNATEIRDLILERLRRFREAGLGDPDEKAEPHAVVAPPLSDNYGDALAAARDLAQEARLLRTALTAPT